MTQRTDGIVGGISELMKCSVCSRESNSFTQLDGESDLFCTSCWDNRELKAQLAAAEEARAQLEPVSTAEPKKSNDELLPLLRVASSDGGGEWLNFEKLAMVEAERAAKAEESRAQLVQSIEQLEAELLMVKQFLHEPGTDLEAWVDGCLARVKELAALVQARPPETDM